ncbi:MAG TPA: hypothetical protein VGS28_02575 [Candidatus Saccharimonadales bacterium]|nr:hypothetical protein [Candidatus Saccharimonadales bacterium]
MLEPVIDRHRLPSGDRTRAALRDLEDLTLVGARDVVAQFGAHDRHGLSLRLGRPLDALRIVAMSLAARSSTNGGSSTVDTGSETYSLRVRVGQASDSVGSLLVATVQPDDRDRLQTSIRLFPGIRTLPPQGAVQPLPSHSLVFAHARVTGDELDPGFNRLHSGASRLGLLAVNFGYPPTVTPTGPSEGEESSPAVTSETVKVVYDDDNRGVEVSEQLAYMQAVAAAHMLGGHVARLARATLS